MAAMDVESVPVGKPRTRPHSRTLTLIVPRTHTVPNYGGFAKAHSRVLHSVQSNVYMRRKTKKIRAQWACVMPTLE
jgi:hypothetical protein